MNFSNLFMFKQGVNNPDFVIFLEECKRYEAQFFRVQ